MDATLHLARDSGGYTLTDRGTWLHFEDKDNLKIMVEGPEPEGTAMPRPSPAAAAFPISPGSVRLSDKPPEADIVRQCRDVP